MLLAGAVPVPVPGALDRGGGALLPLAGAVPGVPDPGGGDLLSQSQ